MSVPDRPADYVCKRPAKLKAASFRPSGISGKVFRGIGIFLRAAGSGGQLVFRASGLLCGSRLGVYDKQSFCYCSRPGYKEKAVEKQVEYIDDILQFIAFF